MAKPALSAPDLSVHSPFNALFSFVSFAQLVEVVFALLFIFWIIYTAIATYHWFRFGHKSSVAIPALITHVLVSGFLAIYAVTGIQ